MPVFKGKTTSSQEGWKSDDGKITRFDIVMDVGGKSFKTQTYSKQIAQEGWEGEVESYEKNGYTLVKQPQKEGFNNYGGKSNYQPRDDASIKAQFAIKGAVSLAGSGVIKLDDIEAQALELFAMVDRVKGTDTTQEVVKEDVVVEDISEEPLDLSDIPF